MLRDEVKAEVEPIIKDLYKAILSKDDGNVAEALGQVVMELIIDVKRTAIASERQACALERIADIMERRYEGG